MVKQFSLHFCLLSLHFTASSSDTEANRLFGPYFGKRVSQSRKSRSVRPAQTIIDGLLFLGHLKNRMEKYSSDEHPAILVEDQVSN